MPCLSQQTLRRLFTLAPLTFLSATLALAQADHAQQSSATSTRPRVDSLVHAVPHSNPKFTNWNSLAEINPSGKVFVVTTADPMHRHTCRVQSFTGDQLACKGLGNKIYGAQEIAALIVPGDYVYLITFIASANAGLGAAIWGTIVLAPVCPPCAAATAFGAFFAFGAAGATLIGDDTPDRLLYLVPGQTLQVKLRY